MESELSAASSFLASYLNNHHLKEPFATALNRVLATRYRSHWHLDDPEQGSAYRCLTSHGKTLDSSILEAAQLVNLDVATLHDAFHSSVEVDPRERRISLGDRWTMWVDPGCVAIRLDGGLARNDHQYIEIYGKLPDKLSGHAVPLVNFLAALVAGSSVNISAPVGTSQEARLTSPAAQDSNVGQPNLVMSPSKRSSKAIQILPPPTRSVSSTLMTAAAAIAPASPVSDRRKVLPQPALLASPFIIPPTPLRPVPSTEDDVFSPTPSGLSASLGLVPRSPSPLSGQSKSYGALSTSSSPLSLERLSLRRGSSSSSTRSASGSGASCSSSEDGEGSDGGVFSSTESLSSSVTSVADNTGSDGKHPTSPRAMPSLPPRPTSPFSFPGHGRSHSSTSAVSSPSFFPMSPSSGQLLAPPLSSGARSLPNSPTKPRRRGTRGGSGAGSQARHAAAAGGSISSMASVTSSPGSTASAATSVTASTSSRTREQAMQGTLTEHSGGKVGVLGGGVLLGLAGVKAAGSARGEVAGEQKRRGRERRVRSRGASQQQQGQGHIPPYSMPPHPGMYHHQQFQAQFGYPTGPWDAPGGSM